MGRRIFTVLGLLALILAVVSPALAEEKPPTTLPLNGRAIQGTITSISGDTWTVATDKFGTLTINVGGAKVQGAGKGKGKQGVTKLSDFRAGSGGQPGDHVVIKLQKQGRGNAPSTAQSTTLTAQRVHLIPGKSFQHFNGQVTAVSGSNLTVKNEKGEERSFTVGASTAVQVGREAKTLSNAGLKVGDKVTVVVRLADNTVTGIKVHGPDNDSD